MCPDCNEQLKITICAHMTCPGCLGKNCICQPRCNMTGISAAQSSVPCQSVFHEWIDRAVLIESPQTWTRPDSLEGSIFPINMHIMLLLRGFLQGFCTHFDWQKQSQVILLDSEVIYQQLKSLADQVFAGYLWSDWTPQWPVIFIVLVWCLL